MEPDLTSAAQTLEDAFFTRESARLLRRGTGHEVITSWTPSAVVEALERVMERGTAPTPPHPDGNALSAEAQMSRFAELIEGVDELVG